MEGNHTHQILKHFLPPSLESQKKTNVVGRFMLITTCMMHGPLGNVVDLSPNLKSFLWTQRGIHCITELSKQDKMKRFTWLECTWTTAYSIRVRALRSVFMGLQSLHFLRFIHMHLYDQKQKFSHVSKTYRPTLMCVNASANVCVFSSAYKPLCI